MKNKLKLELYRERLTSHPQRAGGNINPSPRNRRVLQIKVDPDLFYKSLFPSVRIISIAYSFSGNNLVVYTYPKNQTILITHIHKHCLSFTGELKTLMAGRTRPEISWGVSLACIEDRGFT
jgi:hypothetical protein